MMKFYRVVRLTFESFVLSFVGRAGSSVMAGRLDLTLAGGPIREEDLYIHILDRRTIRWISCKGESPQPECRQPLHNGLAHYLSLYGYLGVKTCNIVVSNAPNIL